MRLKKYDVNSSVELKDMHGLQEMRVISAMAEKKGLYNLNKDQTDRKGSKHVAPEDIESGGLPGLRPK